jgi:transcriptional regulator with XRE-family HTH domain
MTPDEIRAVRKQLGLTQVELAALLGVSRDTISRAERDGRMIPGQPAIYRLLDRFGADAVEALR